MLEQMFLQVLNMTFVGSFVILFVLVARLLLKKAPKKYSYLLWIVVLFRLIVPFSVKSVLSLIPVNPTPIVRETIYSATPQITTGITNVDQSINAMLPAIRGNGAGNPMVDWIFFAALLWLMGVAFFMISGAVSLSKTKNSVKNAIHWKDNVYRSKEVKIPFVMGLVKPRIYMPDYLNQSEEEYILLHEQTHIKRLDHGIRILSYLVLSLHWFNPLVWIAFWRSGDDMEMSCDESVINTLGYSLKKDYSQSLLNFATGKRTFGISPLAFGEGNTKGRIKNILRYKKPRFYIMLAIVVIVIPLAIGLLLNPENETGAPYIDQINEWSEKNLEQADNYTMLINTINIWRGEDGVELTHSESEYERVVFFDPYKTKQTTLSKTEYTTQAYYELHQNEEIAQYSFFLQDEVYVISRVTKEDLGESADAFDNLYIGEGEHSPGLLSGMVDYEVVEETEEQYVLKATIEQGDLYGEVGASFILTNTRTIYYDKTSNQVMKVENHVIQDAEVLNPGMTVDGQSVKEMDFTTTIQYVNINTSEDFDLPEGEELVN
ncbi:hypothetical protein J0B03_10550 [Alkalibacter rhizosphaerae]|uniref:Peptidase M56 domain-containing protein n=1 Tax=Alkalibacter rhizosphaerae TaxID=2815577 RepID=A0A974XLM0_9FIRM|nr:M56 family metallopeptidase [Alkalibacter rhizosphaerae]QSX08221.1 hypothetical protein J0B03_10550 [Alkalibacter rhizosphaerae]